LGFWTNQFELPALTIAELYRQRLQVELFFKWIKYNLRLRCFLGLSFNAVRIQLWSAISVYTLVAIAKKHWALPHSMLQILQVLSVSAFEQVPIAVCLRKKRQTKPKRLLTINSLSLIYNRTVVGNGPYRFAQTAGPITAPTSIQACQGFPLHDVSDGQVDRLLTRPASRANPVNARIPVSASPTPCA